MSDFDDETTPAQFIVAVLLFLILLAAYPERQRL
jgi:hypothetical protein